MSMHDQVNIAHIFESQYSVTLTDILKLVGDQYNNLPKFTKVTLNTPNVYAYMHRSRGIAPFLDEMNAC